MNDLLSTYLIQFVPVIFGVLFVIAMRSLSLAGDKILIRNSQSPEHCTSEETPLDSGTESEDGYKLTFENEARDMLIENGLMGGGLRNRNIQEVALEKLGFVGMKELPRLAKKRKLNNHLRLRLFVTDREALLQTLLNFKGPSGILLSYLAEYRLDVVGA